MTKLFVPLNWSGFEFGSYFPFPDAGVVKGANNPGYAAMLGKLNLTTRLQAVGEPTFESQPLSGLAVIIGGDPSYPDQTISGVSMPPFGPMIMPAEEYLNLYGSLNAKLLSKVYELQAGNSSGVILGELLETARMLKQPTKGVESLCRQLVKSWQRLMKQYPKKSQRTTLFREYNRVYLQWVFGVVPLMRDCDATIDRVKQILEKAEVKRCYANVSGNGISATGNQFDQVYGFRWNTSGSSTWKFSGKGCAAVRSLPRGPNIRPGNFGLRVRDFVPTMYQLFPFSFVLDYFTNMNEFIQSFFAVQSDIVYGWVGTEVTLTGEWSMSGVHNVFPAYELKGSSNGKAKVEQRFVERNTPSLTSNMFRVTGTPSVKQITNLVALGSVLKLISF